MKFKIFLIEFLLLIATSYSALALEITPNTWVNMNPNGDLNAKPDTGNWGGFPAGRAWFPMTYHPHPNVRKMIVFGGGVTSGCNQGYINDVWEYDFPTNSWKQLRASDPNLTWPSGMDNHVMTYDSINNVMWNFGGTCKGGLGYYDYATNSFTRVSKPNAHKEDSYDPGFAFGEGKIVVFSGEPAWFYNPGERTSIFDVVTQTWTDAKPAKSPPPRQQIENVLVYDSFNKKFVLFGGENTSGGLFDDTWEYDLSTNTWTETTPAFSPPARKYHTMVYDSLHKVVIMHGGGGGGALGDTWVYNVGSKTWKQIVSDGPKRYLHGMAYDSVNDIVILFGGADPNNTYKTTFGFRYSPEISDTSSPASPTGLTVK